MNNVKKFKIKEKEEKEENNSSQKDREDWFKPEGELTVDVYQDNTNIIIQAPVAGVSSNNLNVTLEGDMIEIKGMRKDPSNNKEKDYFHKECYWGAFSRKIILPTSVNPDQAEAILKNGVLILKIPKVEEEKKKDIEVHKV
ncbi:MAG: Hsp20/alpha crystallin family protein [Minisyncoccales bacterium]